VREARRGVAGGGRMSAELRRYVLDGMPGSGKSTAFGRAVMAAPACLAFAEINPTRTSQAALKGLGSVERSMWYLERAVAQLCVARLAPARFQLAISDKGPLSVLAFIYASNGPGSAEYAAVERAYLRAIRELCRGERALILLSSVEASLERRTLKRESQKGYPWYDREFLELLISFFEHVAPQLHPQVEVIATTDDTLTETLSVVGDVLGVDLLSAVTHRPPVRDDRFYQMTGHRIDDDEVWEFFEREGGSDFIGQPVTPLMDHHGHRIQFFDRGAIERGRDGARHWDAKCLVEQFRA